MSKYQAYPEYKDSGVEWLGKIPASWSLSKMAWNFKAEKGKSGQLLTKDYCGLNPGKYSVYSGQTENNGVMGRINSYEFDTGEEGVLFSTTVGAKAMHLSHLRGKFSLSQNCMIIVPITKRYQIRFSYYHFQPLFYYERGLIPEHMQASFRMEDLYQYPIALPSLEEQKLIASFLDHETAKIDTLIDKQQQLIQLLKEKRQAVISHAVTKGLPSSTSANTPMRDSGVEWLGEVPEHWVVTQLKFYTLDMQTGPFGSQLHAEDYVTNEIPLINPAHMISGELVPDPNVTVDEETQERLSRHKLAAGDIIFARRGELGRCAVVQEQHEGWLCGTGSLKAKLNKLLIPEYAYLLITSEGVISELSLESKGSTMDNLNTETLGRVRIPVPPVSEQSQILQYVEGVSGKYASLVTKAETAINLMQERRTALISAAVTGKIDVRHPVCHPTGDLQSSKSTVHGDL
jgi:type I restriction enzyme S subunit